MLINTEHPLQSAKKDKGKDWFAWEGFWNGGSPTIIV